MYKKIEVRFSWTDLDFWNLAGKSPKFRLVNRETYVNF